MIKAVPQGLAVPLVTLTTNGSILPIPEIGNHVFLSRSCNDHIYCNPTFLLKKVVRTTLTTCYYDYLVPTTLQPCLFHKVIITNLLCLCMAPVNPPSLPSKSSICKPPTQAKKNLVFLTSNADLSNLP